jgi:hypothetical protein
VATRVLRLGLCVLLGLEIGNVTLTTGHSTTPLRCERRRAF